MFGDPHCGQHARRNSLSGSSAMPMHLWQKTILHSPQHRIIGEAHPSGKKLMVPQIAHFSSIPEL